MATGAELKELLTEIRGGREMDDVTFYTLLNLSKATFERMRAWRKLIKKDTSKSSTGATTYATAFAMPTDFIMTLPRRTLKLVNASSPTSFIDLVEVPFERWDEYKNSAGYFCIDHRNSNYYISSTVSETYTHNFFYIATSTTLTSGASWIFPDEFHPALAFEVAGMDELGMDYDTINMMQGNANIQRARLILQSAIRWDDSLARSALGA
jgi:hypothetical protein